MAAHSWGSNVSSRSVSSYVCSAFTGSERLLDNGLMLVVENEMCGRLNGERMRARAAAAEHALDVGAARGKGSGHSAKMPGGERQNHIKAKQAMYAK